MELEANTAPSKTSEEGFSVHNLRTAQRRKGSLRPVACIRVFWDRLRSEHAIVGYLQVGDPVLQDALGR
jgi:hypothetical protein